MPSKRLRVGLVGLGRIGWRHHCPVLAESRDFTLAAAADADPARCEEAARTYGCRTFASAEAMYRHGSLDVALVATPTHLHKAHALAALRCGLHVFIEKPMAVDPNEARSIVTAARRAGRVLTVYQPQRAIAWFQQASRLLRKGEIGAVYHVRVGRFNFARRNDWQSLGRFGGGMLNNLGSHGLDQLLSITGGEVSKVHCSLRQVASLGDTEDVVKIVYETRSGILGEVDINQACVTVPYEFEAYGTRGMLRKEGDTLVIARLASGRLKAKRLDASLAGANREYPHDEIRVQERVEPIDERFAVDIYKDLARAIRTGAEPFVKPEETLAVMRLIRRCRKSAGDVRRTPL